MKIYQYDYEEKGHNIDYVHDIEISEKVLAGICVNCGWKFSFNKDMYKLYGKFILIYSDYGFADGVEINETKLTEGHCGNNVLRNII